MSLACGQVCLVNEAGCPLCPGQARHRVCSGFFCPVSGLPILGAQPKPSRKEPFSGPLVPWPQFFPFVPPTGHGSSDCCGFSPSPHSLAAC